MKSTMSTVNLSLESTLVGADHIAEGAEELRSKSLFVVMDIIDVLEIQACFFHPFWILRGERKTRKSRVSLKELHCAWAIYSNAFCIFTAIFCYWYCQPCPSPKFQGRACSLSATSEKGRESVSLGKVFRRAWLSRKMENADVLGRLSFFREHCPTNYPNLPHSQIPKPQAISNLSW